MKTKAKPPVKTLELINLKVTRKERKALAALAFKYAGGNLSGWLRYAGSHYKPKKTEVIR